jgi:hypothetical protein
MPIRCEWSNDLRRLREQLEAELSLSARRFEEETGLKITAVELSNAVISTVKVRAEV